jgi:hypothetical protein
MMSSRVATGGMTGGGMTGGGMTGGGMTGGGMTGGGMTGGSVTGGMMGGRLWLAGDGVPVPSIAAARTRAATAASAQNLHPGEVIQFSNGFYVELKDAAGSATTEVLIDPATGAVRTEPGPAMMWNTGVRATPVSADRAKAIAADWLARNHSGETVQSIDAYPGYYTLDTTGAPAESGTAGGGHGMLSVNATTGAVWYHTWHGTFLAKEDS